jgi:Uma2 family endonuclease
MARGGHALIYEENLRVPTDAFTFEGFERWLESDEFPETGRIDFLAGDVEVEMSPEDLFTHGVVKTVIVGALVEVVDQPALGVVFTDSTRVHSRFAELSVEPDVVVVLQETLAAGRVRLVPAAQKGPDRFTALEGAPDLIVEIVSDSSQEKDKRRLPRLYALAGVPELWLVDARGPEIRFEIYILEGAGYAPVAPDEEGWLRSPRLGHAFRLRRRHVPPFPWRYVLEHRPS